MKIRQIQKLIKIVYSFIVRVLGTGVFSVKHVRLFIQFILALCLLCVNVCAMRAPCMSVFHTRTRNLLKVQCDKRNA